MQEQRLHNLLPSAEDHHAGRTIAKYASSRIFRQTLNLITVVLRAKLLGPELYGIWTLLKVIPTYSKYHHLGARTIARYRIPFHHAKGEHEQAAAVANSTFSLSLVIICVVAVGLVITGLVLDARIELRVGLFAMAVLVILQALYEYYVTLMRATEHFSLIIALQYIRSIVAFVLTVLLLYFFGIYGLYITVILTLAVLLIWTRKYYPFTPRLRWDPRQFLSLIPRGMPVIAIGFSISLLTTVDRFIILGFLGTEQLGHYGIAALIFGVASQIPGATREVVEPRMMRALAENPMDATQAYFLLPLVNMAYVMPFLLAPLFFLLPLALPMVLPRYTAGTTPAQIMLLAAYCNGLAYLARMMIVAHQWQLRAMFLMPIVLGFGIAAGVTAVLLKYGIAGVAAASTLSLLLLFLLLLTFISVKLKTKPQTWRRHVAGTLLAIPITWGLLCAAYVLSRWYLGEGWLAAVVGLGTYLVALGVVWRLAAKVLPLLSPLPSWRRLKRQDDGGNNE